MEQVKLMCHHVWLSGTVVKSLCEYVQSYLKLLRLKGRVYGQRGLSQQLILEYKMRRWRRLGVNMLLQHWTCRPLTTSPITTTAFLHTQPWELHTASESKSNEPSTYIWALWSWDLIGVVLCQARSTLFHFFFFYFRLFTATSSTVATANIFVLDILTNFIKRMWTCVCKDLKFCLPNLLCVQFWWLKNLTVWTSDEMEKVKSSEKQMLKKTCIVPKYLLVKLPRNGAHLGNGWRNCCAQGGLPNFHRWYCHSWVINV